MSQVSKAGDPRENSRYLKRFQKLAQRRFESPPKTGPKAGRPGYCQGATPFELVGDMMLIERLPKIESKTSSGIIIPTGENSSYKATAKDAVLELGLVLITGPGDVDVDGNRIEMEVKAGDVIEIPMNVSFYSQFGNLAGYEPYSIGKMRASQALVVFKDYEGTMEVLNGKEG